MEQAFEQFETSSDMIGSRTLRCLLGTGLVLVNGINVFAQASPEFTLDTRFARSYGRGDSYVFSADTRIPGLRGAAESVQFAVDTRGSLEAHPLIGRVFDRFGVPLGAATVRVYDSANRFIHEAATDTSGEFSLSVASSGVVKIEASMPGYRSDARAVDLFPMTGVPQFFSLDLLGPVLPTKTAGSTPAVLVETGKQAAPSGTLLAFDPVALNFTAVSHLPKGEMGGPVGRGKVTIIMTHGWNAKSKEWPLKYATNLVSVVENQKRLTDVANILAWDWETEAKWSFTDPLPVDKTTHEGSAMAAALINALGANYRQRVHFIGHSLGTLVNRYAADELFRQGWPGENLSFTLLDEAELASFILPFQEAYNSAREVVEMLDALDGEAQKILRSRMFQGADWKHPIPSFRPAWMENYISAYGLPIPDAMNVWLNFGVVKHPPLWAFLADAVFKVPVEMFYDPGAHSYSQEWYEITIQKRDAVLAGFRNSPEYNLLNTSALGAYPPTGPYGPGTYYRQPECVVPSCYESADNETKLHPVNAAEFFAGAIAPAILGPQRMVADRLVSAGKEVVDFARPDYNSGVEIFRDSVVSEYQIAKRDGQTALEGFVFASEAVKNGVKDLAIGISQKVDLFFHRLTGQSGGMKGLSEDTNSWQYCVWPLVVPDGAKTFSFDFEISGEPGDSRIICAVNGQRLFDVPTSVFPTNLVQTSQRFIAVDLAGKTNSFVFAVTGSSADCHVRFSNLRFYRIQQPELLAQTAGGKATLSWSAEFDDFTLQSSSSLETTNWSAMVNLPTLFQGQYSVEIPASENSAFFRLTKLTP